MSVASSFNRIYNYVVLANGSTSLSIGLTLFSFNYPILAVYVYGSTSGYVLVTVTPGDEVSIHNNPTIYYMIDYYSGARHIPLAPYEYVNVSINTSKGSSLSFDAYLYDWMGEAP